MNGDTDAIVAHGLTRRFGAHVAVDDVDLTVHRGEVFGLIGPNGAGKTTLIRMLCGIQRPTAGTAVVLGFDLSGETRRMQQQIGYMSQAFSLYRELTMNENLRFYRDVYGGVPQAREDEVCRSLQLDDAARDTIAGELPTGIRQRAALAAAVLHRPSLVFLDEPTSGVDPLGRRELWALMRTMAAEGTTVVVTTHVMTEAERCDRVALMVKGRVLTTGAPDALRASPTMTIVVVDAEPWQDAYATLKALWPDATLRSTSVRVPVTDAASEADVALALNGLRVNAITAQPPSFEDAFVWYVRRATALTDFKRAAPRLA